MHVITFLAVAAAVRRIDRGGSTARAFFDVQEVEDSEALASHFESIVDAPDQYYETERYRRYGIVEWNGKWELVQAGPFVQSSHYNPVLGGKVRYYEPLLHADTPEFQRLVEQFVKCVPHAINQLEVHQIRVCCDGQATNLVPEGIHQDGYDTISITCVARHGIQGAITTLRRAKTDVDPCLQLQLEGGHMLVFDDKRLWHHVSSIALDPNFHKGYRDIYVILARDPDAVNSCFSLG